MQNGSAKGTGSGGVSFFGSDVLGASVVILAAGGIYLGFLERSFKFGFEKVAQNNKRYSF